MKKPIALVAALMIWLAPGLAVAAQAVVIKSSVSGLAVGAMIDEGQAIEVPAGESVTFVTPAGQTLTRQGPFSGAAVGGGSGGDESVVRTISGFLNKKGGETRVGAVRAGGNRSPDDAGVIPLSASGLYCAPEDGAPLWRADTDAPQTFTLREVASRSSADVDFAAGEATAAWPDGVPLRDGGTYLVRTKGSVRSSRLVLSVAPQPLANDAVRLAWMIDQGCSRQADLLIDRLAGG